MMSLRQDVALRPIPEIKSHDHLPPRVSLSDRDALLYCQRVLCETFENAYRASTYARTRPSDPPVAYITLATPDYAWGTRVLLRTLRRYTSVPILVMIPSNYSLHSDVQDVFAINVPTLYRQADGARKEFSQTFTKLWAFSLINFRRIVFLDSDTLVLGSLDDLLDGDEFLVCRDSVEYVELSAFNSGLMAFSPKPHLFQRILEEGATAPTKDGGDQGLLNSLFRGEVKYLGSEFNAIKHYLYFRHPDLRQQDLRMVHYIVKKPWELWYREITDAFCVDLEDLWTSELSRTELLDLISQWRRNQFLAERPRFDVTRQHRKKRKRNRNLAICGLAGALMFGLGALVCRMME